LGKGRYLKERSSQADKDKAVNQNQSPGEEEARKSMFQVELNAAPRSQVPYQSLGHTKHSDVAVGECVLQQADSHSQNCAKDSVAFQQSEIDNGQKRKIKETRQGHNERQKGLQQEGSKQRNLKRRRVYSIDGNRAFDGLNHWKLEVGNQKSETG